VNHVACYRCRRESCGIGVLQVPSCESHSSGALQVPTCEACSSGVLQVPTCESRGVLQVPTWIMWQWGVTGAVM